MKRDAEIQDIATAVLRNRMVLLSHVRFTCWTDLRAIGPCDGLISRTGVSLPSQS